MTAPSSEYISLTCPQCGGQLPSLQDSIICPYCGTRLIRRQAGGTSTGEAPAQVVQGMRFTTYRCTDTQGTGLEVFQMLVPTGWRAQGGVTWMGTNPGMPAVLAFRVSSPNGPEAFEAFPNQPFFWTNNMMARMSFPVGSYYFGNEVRQPMNVQQTLRQLILPRFRNIPGLEVVKEDHLPDLPAQVRTSPQGGGPGVQTGADGARIRFHYPVQGGRIEEELYGVLEWQTSKMPMMFGVVEMIYWMADYMFSFRAREGQLDSLRDMFQTMLTSFKLNPQWFARFSQISQYMIQNQMQQIKDIGELSRYLAQVNNQISDTIMSGYNQRQQVMDRINDRFSQHIRGVNEYYDPNKGYGVELPSGYDHAWANALGEYIVSNDPSFNPNIGSNLDWTPLKQQQ